MVGVIDLNEESVETLINGANGMLIWHIQLRRVACQIDHPVSSHATEPYIRNATRNLSPELNSASERTLYRINKNRHTQSIVQQILR